MGQASSSIGGGYGAAAPSDAAASGRDNITRFVVQPLTPSLKAVRSPAGPGPDAEFQDLGTD